MEILKRALKAAPAQPSESQLWQLLNSLNDVVIAIDERHRILAVNQCWEKTTGFAVETSLEQSFTDFLHPEDLGNWQQVLEQLVQGGSQLIWFRLLHASGEIRWCEMRLQSMRDDSFYPLSATLCDITPQVRNEQVRTATHRSLQSLVDRLPAMLYRSRNNHSWTMEYVSSGCELLTGHSAESLLNQSQLSLGSMIHPDDAEHVWEEVQIALQNQDFFDLSYRLTKASGEEIRVRDKGRGLYSSSGMVLGVEGIILQCD